LGLAFKANSDDVREAASIDLISRLQNDGAQVRAYDPVAMANAAAITTEVDFCEDAYEAVEESDAVVVVTEWNEFKNLDLERIRDAMHNPLLIDGRNLYDPDQLRSLGFDYVGVARGFSTPTDVVVEVSLRGD